MSDFWVFLAKLPLVAIGYALLAAVLIFLSANPDVQTQLAAVLLD